MLSSFGFNQPFFLTLIMFVFFLIYFLALGIELRILRMGVIFYELVGRLSWSVVA